MGLSVVANAMACVTAAAKSTRPAAVWPINQRLDLTFKIQKWLTPHSVQTGDSPHANTARGIK